MSEFSNWFDQVFEGDGGDYRFVMPGVALSGRDVRQEFRDGKWMLTQTEPHATYVVEHEDRTCAVLLLLAARWGYTGTLYPIKNSEETG